MTDGEMQSKGRSMHLHNYEENDTRVNNRNDNEGNSMRVSNNDYHDIDGSNGGAYVRNLYEFDDVLFRVNNRSNNDIDVDNSNDDITLLFRTTSMTAIPKVMIQEATTSTILAVLPPQKTNQK